MYIHWYRQKPDEPLQRILYISSNENVVHEHGVSEDRYEAKKGQADLPASLRIHRVNEEDAGLYYCACWDTLFKQDKPNSRFETDKKNNVFYLIINNVIKSDEATYYCASWDLTICQSQKGPVHGLLEQEEPLELKKNNAPLQMRTLGPRKDFVVKYLGIDPFISDFAIYLHFCRSCNQCDRSGWIKIFAEGTKLIVIPRDKRLEGDFSPKPTVFLPSVAEVNHDNSGTYLCLLEKFFPDAIKVEWKEKNGGTVLESQQGNTIKNGDTYMKFSWLTVTKKSMDREHRCIIKHEFNKGGVDQEIPFPPIDKGNADGDGKSEDANQEDGNGALQLQFANTAAHYTYVLLILKSSIYLAIVTFCLFKRAEVCGNRKSS
ncbi:TCR gamma alternate reading frame protein [Erinaceus europaeus]|uniref:TCR gamma alternate reading frame protein n=1 Tax=Erinaceus europaeus TaxID=9365 RepID=UPI0028FCB79A|nr:TCR gamma alternate reading frame protein [Erinaceus europaeus]